MIDSEMKDGFIKVDLKNRNQNLTNTGLVLFQPTISDLKLLIGTREWKEVMKIEKSKESTIDPNDDGS